MRPVISTGASSSSSTAAVTRVVQGGNPDATRHLDRFEFLKLDSGMTELLRPSLYGAQVRNGVSWGVMVCHNVS